MFSLCSTDAKKTPDTLKDANNAPDATNGGKATGLNAATTAVNAAPNLQQSIDEAANGDLESDTKALATETLAVAPRAAIDAFSGNVGNQSEAPVSAVRKQRFC